MGSMNHELLDMDCQGWVIAGVKLTATGATPASPRGHELFFFYPTKGLVIIGCWTARVDTEGAYGN